MSALDCPKKGREGEILIFFNDLVKYFQNIHCQPSWRAEEYRKRACLIVLRSSSWHWLNFQCAKIKMPMFGNISSCKVIGFCRYPDACAMSREGTKEGLSWNKTYIGDRTSPSPTLRTQKVIFCWKSNFSKTKFRQFWIFAPHPYLGHGNYLVLKIDKVYTFLLHFYQCTIFKSM